MNNFIKKIDQTVIIYVLLALCLGLFIGLLINHKHPELKEAERHQLGYSYISPLIECFSQKSDSPENNRLQEKIENLISEEVKKGKIIGASVYFRDLANGPWIGINESEKFTPASLLKVPIMISYFKLAENNPDILKKEVLIENNFNNDTTPNILPENKIEKGKTYSILDLINYMIIESDNNAANVLLSQISPEILNKTYKDLGLDLPDVEKPENYMTVKDYASFFRILYNASYLNTYYSELALEILAKSKYKRGIVSGLPLYTKAAHKFGERKNLGIDQLHDCGIIYKDNKDYLLCIMTRGREFSDLSSTIADLSRLVYQNVN